MLGSWRKKRFEQSLRQMDPTEVRRESERLHGSLSIQGATLYYSYAGAEVWSLPVDSLILVGERTTDHGPFQPDYFYVFLGGVPVSHYEAPMYANPGLLEDLGRLLGAELVPGLNNRTDFASRVIWPEVLADKPLLEFKPAPRGGLLGRIVDRFVPLVASEWSLDVRRLLESAA
jgi:hypothetical protein